MEMLSKLPPLFIDRMHLQLGESMKPYLAAFEKQYPITIRVNRQKYNSALPLSQVKWETDGYYLPERPVFTLDPLFHAGIYYVQEASSMFLGHAFRQLIQNFDNQPIKVLDLCGAPGGKTTHMASILNADSFLIANEVIKTRAHVLYENVVKWGLPNVLVSQNDPKHFQSLPDFFDVIVVDAPCSGEGLFRRDLNAASEWSVENTVLCAQRQQRIIADVWPSLKSGGFLIYSTCTFNPGENEKNIAWLVDTFQASPVKIKIPTDWGIHVIDYNTMQGYQFLHHKVEGEGFFIAAVKKTSESIVTHKRNKSISNELSNHDTGIFKNWLLAPEAFKYVKNNEAIIAIPESVYPFYAALQQQLNLIKSGLLMGTQKGSKMIPSHELAICTHINKDNFAHEELSELQSLSYLHNESFALQSKEKGYHLVQFKGHPLGWMNNLGNRANNNYPQNWKIRMNLPDKKSFKTNGFLY